MEKSDGYGANTFNDFPDLVSSYCTQFSFDQHEFYLHSQGIPYVRRLYFFLLLLLLLWAKLGRDEN
ncbi:hypothetical protein L211DRAFT_834230 [Terfezia boudieri ATCC MYA-4762]|uniref:Uncharacterized protein n=1 Tax=Terfezia boudieri ATCC MYA-4762 TaxID=1051890 RepID=A0A3N4MDN7_9PEZI|nr:hypothetical protein L211DRAFT_834230 [Terfezia boudieri ATCC MYA-4762]